MDHRVEAAQEWAANTNFPNSSLQARIDAQRKLSDIAAANTKWFTIFAAGLIGDLGRTLPDNDSWRNASARIGDRTIGPTPPDTTGSTLGTAQDFDDIAPPGPRHEWTNLVVALPSLGGNLPAAAAALVAFATNVDGNIFAATEELAAAALLDVDVMTSAVTWLAHRRFQYGIGQDAFPIVAAVSWAQRAITEADQGIPWDTDETEVISRDEELLVHSVDRQVRLLLAAGLLDDDMIDPDDL